LRKIKEVSLALLVSPILFSGCMQEKISTIVPLKSTDKSIALNAKSISHPTEAVDSDIKIVYRDTTLLETPLAQESELLASLLAYEESERLEKNRKKALEDEENAERDIDAELQELTEPKLALNNDWEEASKEDEIIETAEQFLGVKYVWAANGPSAFDCSGFTKYVFKQNGISLPRHSGRQADIGEKIAFDELEKGDLVFFDTRKKSKQVVNHVGIYIGNHQFIHASSGGKKVMITSFDEKKFYKQKFLYARRVLNAEQNVAMNMDEKSTLTN